MLRIISMGLNSQEHLCFQVIVEGEIYMSSIVEMNQNQEPAPPELTPIPIYFNIYDEGELKTQFAIAITPAQIAYLMYGIIPDWLKDSQAAIPMDESKDRDTARSQQALLQTGRIAMKGFVAASGMLLNM